MELLSVEILVCLFAVGVYMLLSVYLEKWNVNSI